MPRTLSRSKSFMPTPWGDLVTSWPAPLEDPAIWEEWGNCWIIWSIFGNQFVSTHSDLRDFKGIAIGETSMRFVVREHVCISLFSKLLASSQPMQANQKLFLPQRFEYYQKSRLESRILNLCVPCSVLLSYWKQNQGSEEWNKSGDVTYDIESSILNKNF